MLPATIRKRRQINQKRKLTSLQVRQLIMQHRISLKALSEQAAPLGGVALLTGCPMCGAAGVNTLLKGTDRLFGTTDKTFLVVQCIECHLMHLNPTPAPEELAAYYTGDCWVSTRESTGDELAELWRGFVLGDHVPFCSSCRRERSVQRNRPRCRMRWWIVSQNARAAARPDSRVSDNSPDAARVAWHSNGVPAICANLLQAPLAVASCSLITMYHVLEHLYDPAAYIEEGTRTPDERRAIRIMSSTWFGLLHFVRYSSGVRVPSSM